MIGFLYFTFSYNTDHDYDEVCNDDGQTPQLDNAHKNRTDEQSGVIATKEENAADDFETHGSQIDEISENEHDLW